MQVEPAHRHKKDLSFGAQAAARANQPGHGFELVRQAVARREGGGQRDRGQAVRDGGFCAHGPCGDLVVLVFKGVGARLLHQLGHGGLDRRRAVNIAFDRVDRHGSAAADLIRQRTVARQKHRVAADVDAGEQRGAVGRQRQVADVAAPADGGAFRRRRLPDRLLVVVREQFGRQRIGFAVCAAVLGLGQRHHQRADIELHRGLARIEQAAQTGHGRMQRKLPPACQGRGGVEQRGHQR